MPTQLPNKQTPDSSSAGGLQAHECTVPVRKIVFYAPNFCPMIGGVENIVKGLATELTRLGHSVRVLTLARSGKPDDFPFGVVRGAGFLAALRHIRWADVVVHVNISLRGILPMLLVPRPLVVYHNGLYQTHTLSGRLKWLVARRMAINVGCSPYIARLFSCTDTIPNPYNDALFRPNRTAVRTKELLFVGRLVSDKGCVVLLNALHELGAVPGLKPALTIIGDGPQRPRLRVLVRRLGLTGQVRFVGARVGEPLVQAMNEHRILVVPSDYDEPFGAVAVEGIACGCLVISSDGGGLPDTVGPCGLTFPKGDYLALADLLQQVLTQPHQPDADPQAVRTHLSRHTLRAVTERFTAIFTRAIHV